MPDPPDRPVCPIGSVSGTGTRTINRSATELDAGSQDREEARVAAVHRAGREAKRARPRSETAQRQRCRIRARRMLTVVHGIDSSGDAQKWTPGCGRSNVWIATAQVHDNEPMKLVAFRAVQDLPGGSRPFDLLVGLLAGGEYCAAGIDAPFGLPARHMPDGGLPILLQDVAELPTGSRPFTKGAELVAYAKENALDDARNPGRNRPPTASMVPSIPVYKLARPVARA